MSQTPVIIGLDEAGRGALAGPVVAGACFLPDESIPSFIQDSKALSPEIREKAFEWIQAHCTYGYGIVSAQHIDQYGILASTEKAMQEALAMVAETITPTYVLTDGRDKFWFNYPHSSIIRGDESEPCISAGSIIAKVTRDTIMKEYASQFPQYDFASHKGYGSAEHIATIRKYGICTLHRTTFLTKILSVHTTPTEVHQ